MSHETQPRDIGALIKDRRSFSPEQLSGRKVHRDVVEEILRAGLGAHAWHDATMALHGVPGRGIGDACTGMPVWYQTAMEGREVSEAKMTKLRHRLDACNCVIGIGMVPDVNGRISQEDEEWALHLPCKTCIS